MKNKWNKMSTSKKNTLEIIIALIIMISFIGFRLYSNYKTAKKETEYSKEVHLVSDNSRYFTVISCIEKYLNTVETGNKNNILLTLDSEYKKAYNINEKNINNYIPKLEKDKMYNYSVHKMYEKRISKNVSEYYIYGDIVETIMDESILGTSYDITIILYEDKFLFSVRPGAQYE